MYAAAALSTSSIVGAMTAAPPPSKLDGVEGAAALCDDVAAAGGATGTEKSPYGASDTVECPKVAGLKCHLNELAVCGCASFT